MTWKSNSRLTLSPDSLTSEMGVKVPSGVIHRVGWRLKESTEKKGHLLGAVSSHHACTQEALDKWTL